MNPFLRNSHCSRIRIGVNHFRHNRSINDPQSVDAKHSKSFIHHCICAGAISHPARTCWMCLCEAVRFDSTDQITVTLAQWSVSAKGTTRYWYRGILEIWREFWCLEQLHQSFHGDNFRGHVGLVGEQIVINDRCI